MPANEDQSTAPARKAKGMPYIMPDGRPLSAFLADNNLLKRHSIRKSKEPTQGWSSASPSLTSKNFSTYPPPTEAESAELAALSRVGQRRQRRWLNDRLLRDMAPALTAKEMVDLFKPAPFGDTGYVSAFTQAASSEHAHLWDLFRSVDSDKEERVLKKWEQHVKELRRGGDEESKRDAAAVAALQGWSAIGPRGRKALRRAHPGCIEDLEGQILKFCDDLQEAELVLILEDSFQRLLAHSISEFHSLQSFGRDGADGRREVVIRRHSTSGMLPLAVGVHRISCADVLWLLEEDNSGGNISLQTLHESILRPIVGASVPGSPTAAPALAV